MSAVSYNLVMEAGVDFPVTVTWKDGTGALVNLVGYTAKLQIRTSPGAALLIEKKTADATIVLGGAAGTIVWTITAADNTALAAQTTAMHWDLLMTSPTGVNVRLLQGLVIVVPAITV